MNETKGKILQSAITVWGHNLNASLDDIASHIDISRRTLHRHYSGRDDLMNSVFNYIIELHLTQAKVIKQAPSSLKNKLKSLLYYDIESGSKYLIFCQLRKTNFEEMKSENIVLQELYAIYMDLFQQLKDEKKIREELSLQWLEIFYSTVIESVLKSIDSNGNKEECLNMGWSSYWNAIKTQ